jgi:elongation factor P hydroxylase
MAVAETDRPRFSSLRRGSTNAVNPRLTDALYLLANGLKFNVSTEAVAGEFQPQGWRVT